VDHISYKLGDHQLKFGGDYRYVSPITPTNQLSTAQIFDSVSALETDSLFVGDVGYSSGYAIAYKTLSTYAQDTWKALPKLTLDYGVRWEINPAPTGKNGKTPLTVQSLNQNTTDFSYLQFAPAGTPLYKTSYTDLRLDLALRIWRAKLQAMSWCCAAEPECSMISGKPVLVLFPSLTLRPIA